MSRQYKEELEASLISKSDEMVDSLPHFAKKYFDHLRNLEKSERTIQQYAFDIYYFFEWIRKQAGYKNINIDTSNASDILDLLTIDDINEYTKTYSFRNKRNEYGKIIKVKTSAAYRARRASSLRGFFEYYRNIGEIKSMVGKLIDIPKINEKNIVALDSEQVSRILQAVTDHSVYDTRTLIIHKKVELRDYALLILGFGTGLRVSEIIGLDLNDIDFNKAEINVSYLKGGKETKVYFGQEVESALKDYMDNCRPTLLGNNNNDSLFLSLQGTRLTVRAVEKITTKYAKQAGLSDTVTPHVMRKTFGTALYRNTSDIYLVKEALHHSNISTTVSHYAKQSEDNMRKIAKESDKLFVK